MSTVSKTLADQIAAADGRYMDDPRVVRIIRYTNRWGGIGYALEYAHSVGKYSPSEYVQEPEVYWEVQQ